MKWSGLPLAFGKAFMSTRITFVTFRYLLFMPTLSKRQRRNFAENKVCLISTIYFSISSNANSCKMFETPSEENF